MRAFGAPTEDLEAVEAALQQQAPAPVVEDFEVYHDNWLIVQIFERTTTQWIRAGIGAVRTGLNYAGVDVVVRRFVPRKLQREVWDALELMERAVIVYDSEQAAD